MAYRRNLDLSRLKKAKQGMKKIVVETEADALRPGKSRAVRRRHQARGFKGGMTRRANALAAAKKAAARRRKAAATRKRNEAARRRKLAAARRRKASRQGTARRAARRPKRGRKGKRRPN